MGVGNHSHALDLVDGRVSLSGSIFCKKANSCYKDVSLRTRARKASDDFFPELGNEPSEYVGKIFEFRGSRPNQTSRRHLTRKEALFGEFGRPIHRPLVTFNWDFEDRFDTVLVIYQDLNQEDLEYLRKLLPKIGLRET